MAGVTRVLIKSKQCESESTLQDFLKVVQRSYIVYSMYLNCCRNCLFYNSFSYFKIVIVLGC